MQITRKHEGFDRTGDHAYESRAKMSQDLATVINDGLYYYEQDLRHDHDTEDETGLSFMYTKIHSIHLYSLMLIL